MTKRIRAQKVEDTKRIRAHKVEDPAVMNLVDTMHASHVPHPNAMRVL